MATSPTIAQRIDSELSFASLLLGDLPDIARDWRDMAEGERVSWSLDWDQQLGYLRLLDTQYRDGSMTAAQRSRYEALLATLKAALPTVEQLGLQRPPVPLDC